MKVKCYQYDDFSVYTTDITTEATLNKRERERLTEQKLLNYIYDTDIRLGHDDNGKPFLIGNSKDFISISHSKHQLCIAISSTEIGVDIEEFDRRLERVMTKFLTLEQVQLLPKDELRRLPILALCWSQKEAAYKLLGKKAGAIGENVVLDIQALMKNADIGCELQAIVNNTTLKMTIADINNEYEIVVCKYMNK